LDHLDLGLAELSSKQPSRCSHKTHNLSTTQNNSPFFSNKSSSPSHPTKNIIMNRFPNGIVALILACIPIANAFTISLAPLLIHWGNNYVNQFSQTAPSSQSSASRVVQKRLVEAAVSTHEAKRSFALDNLKFDEVDMLSDYKCELLDYVYSKSMDRSFA
jgi:hypothetical protein